MCYYLFSKYAWVVPLKEKKAVSIVHNFKKSNRKANKIWVDQGSEFYNNVFKNVCFSMYSTYNEGKSVVAERFIRTLKNKITTISKNVYFDVLVNKYNNTYHKTNKMKPADVADNSFAEYNEDPKFKVGDHVRILKFKNVFAEGYTPNWSEEIFVVKKIKNTVPWTYIINDLNGEEIAGSFYEKELQKTNQKEFRIEKVIKRKGNKLYVKWTGYNNYFNSWIDKKHLIK